MEIIDNFLPEHYANELLTLVSNGPFPWYYMDATVHPEYRGLLSHIQDNKIKDSTQFVHGIIHDGKPVSDVSMSFLPLVLLLDKHLNESISQSLVRVKINCLLKDANYPDGYYNEPHTDDAGPSKTMIYYLNDSDGDTVIFNERFGIAPVPELTEQYRITPKKNRAIFFDSSFLHASTPPKNTDRRLVINYVFRG